MRGASGEPFGAQMVDFGAPNERIKPLGAQMVILGPKGANPREGCIWRALPGAGSTARGRVWKLSKTAFWLQKTLHAPELDTFATPGVPSAPLRALKL